MVNIPNDVDKLLDEYIKKKSKRPKTFNYDEQDSFEQYKEYLKKELEKLKQGWIAK